MKIYVLILTLLLIYDKNISINRKVGWFTYSKKKKSWNNDIL